MKIIIIIINLVISDSNNFKVIECSLALVSIGRAHPALQINGPVVLTLRFTPTAEINFRRANYEAMKIHFNYIDWDSVLCDALDFSVIISNFYIVIQKVIDIFIPKSSKIKLIILSGIVGN